MQQTTPNTRQHSNGSTPAEAHPDTLAKVMTRSAFLHVQDARAIGKLKLWIGRYRQGRGCEDQAAGYVDVDAARVIFQDLALRGELPAKLYEDREIVFYGGGDRDGRLEARLLKFADNPDMRAPLCVEVSRGPGRRNTSGGIQPAGDLQRVAIWLSRFEARKLAAAVLAQLDRCQCQG